MPAVIKKYPLYVSDEPVTYRQFNGGINLDPSNEHLNPNELRDALNVHYLSGGIVKRKGAKILSTIISEEDIKNVQGISLFTTKMTYLILAADGKLFYGIYSPNSEISLTRLPIKFSPYKKSIVHDPLNLTVGLERYQSKNLPNTVLHNGYVVEENDSLKYIGDFNLLPENFIIELNNYFLYDKQYYQYIGSNLNSFATISFVKPDSSAVWLLKDTGALTNLIGESQLNNIITWSSSFLKYFKGQLVKYGNSYYECVVEHFVRNINVAEDPHFRPFNEINETLIFQNLKPVEAATFNNVLYMATGTRIVNIYPDTNGKLIAYVISPKLLNNIVQTQIGNNHLSPYPEFALQTETDQAITSIGALIPEYSIVNGSASFILRPIMTLASNEDIDEYYFRWEKLVNNQWRTIVRFEDNFYTTKTLVDGIYVDSVYKVDYSTLTVNDAMVYKYRVSFAKSFEVDESPTETTDVTYVSEELTNINGEKIVDFKINKIDGSFFGQAASVIYDLNLQPDALFKTIHTCTKVHADGNKFCFYDDAMNSGEWFKTVINNPNYITLRGGLSFKTNKNEALVKVVAFSGFIIAFANSSSVGGSIHLIKGNGDDVETDQYYSPYRRVTISPNVSCDNPRTVQVAENLLIFKHYNTIYYIQAGELDQDKVNLYSANDKVKFESRNVKIPWEDNNCISEITDDYYAILWHEKNIVEPDGTVTNLYPATRLKMYFKLGYRQDNKVYYPWLKDESDVFNSEFLFYVNNNPIYLYNNTLVGMNDLYYKDFNTVYPVSIRLKSYDLEKPKMYKLLDNTTFFYNRNHSSDIDMEVEGFNEAGHKILEWKNKPLVQDRKTLKVGDLFSNGIQKLDTPIIESKVVNSTYKFPFLLVELLITSKSENEFTFSSVTFNYTTVDIPDQNPYGLYKDVVRKGDDFRVTTKDSTLLESVKQFNRIEQTSQANGLRIFISKDEPVDINTGDLWYDIE